MCSQCAFEYACQPNLPFQTSTRDSTPLGFTKVNLYSHSLLSFHSYLCSLAESILLNSPQFIPSNPLNSLYDKYCLLLLSALSLSVVPFNFLISLPTSLTNNYQIIILADTYPLNLTMIFDPSLSDDLLPTWKGICYLPILCSMLNHAEEARFPI